MVCNTSSPAVTDHALFRGQTSTVLFTALVAARADDPAKVRQLRDRLCNLHRNLARKVAHREAAQCPEPFEDLAQLAIIGLLKAIDRFEPAKGNAFSSFAVPYIRGEIQHFLRDHWSHVKVPRRAIELSSRVKATRRKLMAMGRELDEARLALLMGVPAAKWRWTCEALDREPLLDLDDVQQPIAEPVYHATESDPEWQQQLCSQLEALENPYRIALMEAYMAGLSIKQIARRHESDDFQVKVWLQTGLNLLTTQRKIHAYYRAD